MMRRPGGRRSRFAFSIVKNNTTATDILKEPLRDDENGVHDEFL